MSNTGGHVAEASTLPTLRKQRAAVVNESIATNDRPRKTGAPILGTSRWSPTAQLPLRAGTRRAATSPPRRMRSAIA